MHLLHTTIRKMPMKAGALQEKKPIFVHSDLDEAGLDVYEFRLLGHIARRGKCFATLTTTAKICKMSVRKAQSTLKSLENRGLIQKEQRKGSTDIYKLAPDIWDKLQTMRQEQEVDLDDSRNTSNE